MFKEKFDTYNWEEVKQSILTKTDRDVVQALQKDKCNIEDFKALISPAAAPYLEQMARLSNALTQKRFGKTIQMYTPLYLSNECQNICTYCAFSLDNKIKRKTLSDDEILKEVEVIKQMGYNHVLLVTGEASQTVGLSYLQHAVKLIRPYFSHISIEVQPLDQADYETLLADGLNTVLVYQETYHKENYRVHHPKGKKSNFDYRLETPDRLGKAKVHKIGLGVLIGLEDWRTDCFFTALHLDYLEKTYWQTKYSISFPRLRPIEVGTQKNSSMKSFTSFMSDKELVQLICAYRIFNPEVELSISTRENEKFRNHIIKLGVTSMSAGSKTNPGGYAVDPQSLEQFEISDERTPKEIAAIIKQQGYEPVWKDWDSALVICR
ncbi:MAG: 2-iminoacetate synthase ThiH [Bacteroidia bacterium]